MEIVGVFQDYFWRCSAEHDQEKSKIAVSSSIIKLLSLKNPLKNSVFCDRSGTVKDNRPKFSNNQKSYKHQIIFDLLDSVAEKRKEQFSNRKQRVTD